MLAANERCTQMNSEQEASEKVAKNAKKGRWSEQGRKPVLLGRGHRFFLTIRTDRCRAILWTA